MKANDVPTGIEPAASERLATALGITPLTKSWAQTIARQEFVTPPPGSVCINQFPCKRAFHGRMGRSGDFSDARPAGTFCPNSTVPRSRRDGFVKLVGPSHMVVRSVARLPEVVAFSPSFRTNLNQSERPALFNADRKSV